ncbi:MAG: DNA mismatch repair protein MutS, partial [Clostridia bacterium]|nr:DNA mismatch repair protein MutS [Clostridia bacterium]
TPGTVIESSMLEEGESNYLGIVHYQGQDVGLAFCDISTAQLQMTVIVGGDHAAVTDELARFAPAEIILAGGAEASGPLVQFCRDHIPSVTFHGLTAIENPDLVLQRHFGKTARELGLTEAHAATLSLLFDYIDATNSNWLKRLGRVEVYEPRQFLKLSADTRRDLELTETMRSHEKRGSLLQVIDFTRTAMGKRMLRTTMQQPLVSPTLINNRLNAVEELLRESILRMQLAESLSGISDLERLLTRVLYGSASPREVAAIGHTLSLLPGLKQILAPLQSRALCDLRDQIDSLPHLCELITTTLSDELPVALRDGGVIREGVSAELDELRGLVGNSRGALAAIEREERERTGIKTLKIGYNRVFGYYIEVSRSYTGQVPETYIRKQTLTNGERYITPELTELEQKILSADQQISALEEQIFDRLRDQIRSSSSSLSKTAAAIARLDSFYSLAEAAFKHDYCRPEVDDSGEIRIVGGRHPVVETLIKEPFVANDTDLSTERDRIAIITGPNMAGKSTYMRQVALIVLLAQMGSFVPAQSARIGVVDSIYTRVGASDDL